MKKKIAAVLILSTLIAGTVSASSINGDYKGNPIVKVKSNGVVVPVEDTPAIVYNDRTMVPIYLLKSLGANVTWNQADYSVDVSIASNSNQNTSYYKKMVSVMDCFVLSENTAEYIESIGRVLSSYFTNVNNNYSFRTSSVELDDDFNKLSETVNENVRYLRDFSSSLESSDTANKLRTHADLLLSSLENLRLSKNNLIGWENYRTADPNRSETHFTNYLEYSKLSFNDTSTIITQSGAEYRNHVSAVLNN
jgi:hypothetical protein